MSTPLGETLDSYDAASQEVPAAHIDANMEHMSKEELLSLMTREEKKVKDLQARIKKAKVQNMEKKLQQAEIKKFSKKERANIQDIFDKLDTDKSGFISTAEFGVLCVNMGYEMTPSELDHAVASINKNDDGGIDFDEFLLWWGSSSDRGGNKGAKLDLIKAKLRASMLADDVRTHMKKHSVGTSVDQGSSRRQTLTFNASIGDQGDESEGESRYKTSCEFVMIPSDPLHFKDEVHKTFPKEDVTVFYEGSEVQIRYMMELIFEMSPNCTQEDIDAAVSCFNDAFEPVNESTLFHLSASAQPFRNPKPDDSRSQIHCGLFMRTPPEEDPITKLTSLFLHTDDVDACGARLFTVLSALVHTRQDGENFLKWDCETPILELLDQASVHAHVKLSSQVNELFESFLFATMVEEKTIARDSQVREVAVMAALGRLFEAVDVSIVSHSTKEAMESALDTIASFPLKVAMKRGTFDDEVAKETTALKARFKKNLDDIFKTQMTVPILMSRFLSKLLEFEEYSTAIQSVGIASTLYFIC